MTAVFPGSFDPITLGHIDIIERAAKVFDKVIVGVLNNSRKAPMFSEQERLDMVCESVKHISNVEVVGFGGLTVDFAKMYGANVIVRGVRNYTDFDYEHILSAANRALYPELDTVFFATDPKYFHISSSSVKEIALFGGDVSSLVPAFVERSLKNRFACKK